MQSPQALAGASAAHPSRNRNLLPQALLGMAIARRRIQRTTTPLFADMAARCGTQPPLCIPRTGKASIPRHDFPLTAIGVFS